MKLNLNDVGSIIDATTAKNTINSNSEAIELAVENTLSRDGTQPNSMGSTLDMDSHQIINLPIPITANSPLRLQDLSDFVGGGTVTNIPQGGTTGQVLDKASNTDYDVAWVNSVTSVGLAMPADFTVTHSPVTTTGTLTATLTNTPTGTGGFVRQTSPTLVTPVLGVASGTSLNLSGLTASSAVATDSSKNLTSVTNTGSGNNVLATSPTLVTPALGTPSSVVLTNATGTASGLTAGNVTTNANLTGAVTSAGNATSLGSFTSANLATALTDETGSGANVFANTPTLVTPVLGAATGTSLNLSGLTASSAVATDVSKNLVSVTNTGTGSNVLATSPTLVTPALGTPSSVVLTNATGTASGLTAGNVTTNANLTGAVTSVGNVTSLGSFTSANLISALTDETGSGSSVFANTPTLVTPVLGAATGTSLNLSGLTASSAIATDGSKNLVSVTNTGSGSNVLATSPTLVTPLLGTPTSGVATNITGLPLTTGVTGVLPRANGGSDYVLLSTLTASSSATLVDTTSITASYNLYVIEFEAIVPATDAQPLRMRVSTDGGSSYTTTAYLSIVSLSGFTNDTSTTYIPVSGITNISPVKSIAGYGVSGSLKFIGPNNGTTRTQAVGQVGYIASTGGTYTQVNFSGLYDVNTAINALQFSFASGNISSGKIRIYGIKTT